MKFLSQAFIDMKFLTVLIAAGLLAVQWDSVDAKPVRSAAVVSEFKRHTPCPATGLRRGKCPGYEIDHITPL